MQAHESEYIAQLAALPLQQIRDEPAALAQAAGQLTQSLTALCHAQYPTFLLAHGSSSTLRSTLSALDDTLSSLIGSLQPLNDQCSAFAKATQPVLADRRAATLLLEHHDKLLDLLELPQLLTTCIVNSSYQDALDLIAHARQLAVRFPDVAVVQDVLAEVEHAARVMAAQLLGVLREPAKLPVLFRAVNFLRRMAELDEDELALAFLTSRLALFDATVSALCDKEKATATELTGEDDARFLHKYADVFRESAYDIVSQFTTIFLERAPAGSAQHAELHHLLSAFVHTLVQRIASLVRSTLVPANPARLPQAATVSSLLTHLSYTSASLARLGLDFRALLDAPAAQSVLLRIRIALEAAADDFVRALPQHLSSKPPEQAVSSGSRALHVPPPALASYPPLAALTNALAGVLNNLRLLAPPVLCDEVHALFARALVRCGIALRAAQGDWASAALQEYTRALVPFIERALLEGIFATPKEKASDSDPPVNGSEASADRVNGDDAAHTADDVVELHRLLKDWETRIEA
ncbi:Dor1-domain-containing protein [Auricularia subglabra TFB-10046 SS5]|nr:Dor1-domain-containing protein [Auricularia subglabra TFB-10046 SS5]